MPIPARLSRRLHETLGDEAAADMVDWMQRVDAQRAELRELNELNYARFDARFNEVGVRFNKVDARFDEVNARFGEMEARFNEVSARFAQFEATIVGRLEATIEQRTADLMKWSFVFWVGAVGAVAVLTEVFR